MSEIGRNDPCPCGSGKKYKHCCQQRAAPVASGGGSHGAAPAPAARAHYDLGMAFLKQGNQDAAISSYRKALALKPDYAEAYVNLGNVLHEQGKLDEAVENFRKALALNAGLAQAHYNMGNALYVQNKLSEAAESFRNTIALKPNFAGGHNNLGLALQAQGKLDEAVTCYRKALALDPDSVDAHVNLGGALQVLGKLDEAAWHYRSALASRPDLPDVYVELGNALGKLGGPDSAKEAVLYYQKAFSARTKLCHEEDKLSPGLLDVYLELTNKCNFHCDFCPSDFLQRPQGYMSMELIRKIYSEVAEKKLAPQIKLHLMGEPTLHPDFMEILAFASSRNVKTNLVTNGSTMNAKSAPNILNSLYGSLVVSLQTPTRETYKHRGDVGLDWDRYIGNIRLLVREHLRRVALRQPIHCTVELHVMITRDSYLSANIIQTEGEVSAVLQEWSDFVSGIEREFGLPPFQHKKMLDAAMKTIISEQHGRPYPLQQGLTVVFLRGFPFANTRLSSDYKIAMLEASKFCRRPFTDAGVLCNGDVTLCCLDYDGQLVVGNVRDDTMEAVIYGERARNLRAAMLSLSPMPPFCQQCQAEAILSESVKPVNFIMP